jgi:hypothetical protein
MPLRHLIRKTGTRRFEGFFVYPLNCASVSITFAKVIPPDPLPEEVGERFEFSWIVPKDRPWKVGDRLATRAKRISIVHLSLT